MVKKKLAQFSEDARYHQAVKTQTLSSIESFEISTEQRLQYEADAMVNANRLQSCVSKVGTVLFFLK